MAHLAKFKAPSCGHMLDHYKRNRASTLKRDNIDPEKTPENYTIGRSNKTGEYREFKGAQGASWALIKKRMDACEQETGKAIRKDAVVMADMVVTLPRNVPESDMHEFFRHCHEFLGKKVGFGNLMGGYVHLDETTPHIHLPFTPVKDGRFSFAKVCPRSFYKTFHKELGDYLEERMGYRPEIELGEEKAQEKALSNVPQTQLNAARAALEALEAQKGSLEEEVAQTRSQLVSETERLESLRREGDAVAERVEKLESIVADVRGFEAADKSGKREILDRIGSRCKEFAGAVRTRIDEVKGQIEPIRRRLENLLARQRAAFAPPRQRSLNDDIARAREAARAINRGYVHSPSRGRSR